MVFLERTYDVRMRVICSEGCVGESGGLFTVVRGWGESSADSFQ